MRRLAVSAHSQRFGTRWEWLVYPYLGRLLLVGRRSKQFALVYRDLGCLQQHRYGNYIFIFGGCQHRGPANSHGYLPGTRFGYFHDYPGCGSSPADDHESNVVVPRHRRDSLRPGDLHGLRRNGRLYLVRRGTAEWTQHQPG